MEISSRIANIRRSGIREIFDLARQIPDLINLGIGEPDFRPPYFVNAAAKRAINQGLGRYTENTGLSELREAISAKLRRENAIRADPANEIIVTSGATQAIFLVMNCLLNPGDEVLLPSPAFTAYEYAVSLAGGKSVQVPMELEGGLIDLREFRKRVSKRTKIVVLNSPCNPTGAVYSEKEILGLADFALQNNLTLIADEIYEKYLYEDSSHFSPASREEFRRSVVTINGFSKTFSMTGWRLGYAVAPEEVISAMTRFNMYDAVCANSIAQRAGIAALKGSGNFFKPILKRYDRARRTMCKYLDEIDLPYGASKGAFYVFPSISKISGDSRFYCKQLLEKQHVAAIPGSSFGRIGEGHIRLSYSTDKRSLELGMERMRKFNMTFKS